MHALIDLWLSLLSHVIQLLLLLLSVNLIQFKAFIGTEAEEAILQSTKCTAKTFEWFINSEKITFLPPSPVSPPHSSSSCRFYPKLQAETCVYYPFVQRERSPLSITLIVWSTATFWPGGTDGRFIYALRCLSWWWHETGWQRGRAKHLPCFIT